MHYCRKNTIEHTKVSSFCEEHVVEHVKVVFSNQLKDGSALHLRILLATHGQNHIHTTWGREGERKNLKLWWEISIYIINLVFKPSAQHLIGFILKE